MVKVTTGLLIYDTQCSSKFFKQDIAKTIFNEKFISNYLFYVELFLRLKREFGEAIFLEKTHELSLTRWKDISASKVKPIDFLKAPIELYKILKDYR
ncbi:hypothetical protein AXK12_05985 [Cephaloticoccus capnophilus]|uniref:Uncharacterized protein n=1 Tax=Cephaloticoccus capnophilus TaxID=1548208 RepID=A0A139SL44_9BACT|nr:hypothetical protein AXK12_05985 [Cephaloticoccus capnophilus]